MGLITENAEDLADQSLIQYGTLLGGSTMTFFRDSKIETYQKMWRWVRPGREISQGKLLYEHIFSPYPMT